MYIMTTAIMVAQYMWCQLIALEYLGAVIDQARLRGYGKYRHSGRRFYDKCQPKR